VTPFEIRLELLKLANAILQARVGKIDEMPQSVDPSLLPFDGAALGDDRPSDMVNHWLSLTPTEQSAEIMAHSELSQFIRAWISTK
jgi:hypothetical protein